MWEFIVDENGWFAALVIVLGLIFGIAGVIQPWLKGWLDRKREAAHIAISSLDVSDLVVWGRARELRFTLSNSGRRVTILTALRLVVTDHGDTTEQRRTITSAPIEVHEHRVELRPEETDYDIRRRRFTSDLPPLELRENESVAFVVKLVSPQSHWYRFVVVVNWTAVESPDRSRTTTSEEVRAVFPREIRGTQLGRDGDHVN